MKAGEKEWREHEREGKSFSRTQESDQIIHIQHIRWQMIGRRGPSGHTLRATESMVPFKQFSATRG